MTSREYLICSFKSYCITPKNSNHLYWRLVCRNQDNGKVQEHKILWWMSLLVQGFNLSKLIMEAQRHVFVGPPNALCHSTSSLPPSRSTTFCWRPLPCPRWAPPPLPYRWLAPPLLLAARLSQWHREDPGPPLCGKDRWGPLLLPRWPWLPAECAIEHSVSNPILQAGWWSEEACIACGSAQASPPVFKLWNSAAPCTCWPWLSWALDVIGPPVHPEDRDILSSCSVTGAALLCCGLDLPPLLTPLVWLWHLWPWPLVQWENLGANRSPLTPVSSQGALEAEGSGGPGETSTSRFPFSVTEGACGRWHRTFYRSVFCTKLTRSRPLNLNTLHCLILVVWSNDAAWNIFVSRCNCCKLNTGWWLKVSCLEFKTSLPHDINVTLMSQALTQCYLIYVDEETIRLHLGVNDSAFRPLSLQELLKLRPLLLKIRANGCFIQLSDKQKAWSCSELKSSKAGSSFLADLKGVICEGQFYLRQLGSRRFQQLINVIGQRLSAHWTYHSQLLLEESYRLLNFFNQKLIIVNAWPDIRPSSRFSLLSYPPPTPSPSGGAPFRSGWRSDQGSGSESNGSS